MAPETQTRTGSRPTRAGWTIAISLAVIAACLVVLVLRTRPQKAEQVETPVKADPATPALATSPAYKDLPLRAPPRVTRKAPAAAIPPVPTPAPVAAAQPSRLQEPPPGIAPERPPVSGGLAPLTGSTPTNQAGIIRGRVTLQGKPPPESMLPLDAYCGKLPNVGKTTRNYLVSTNGGLANVFIYIKDGLQGKRYPAPKEPATVAIEGCGFEPFVVGLMAGQYLAITNADPFPQNLRVSTDSTHSQLYNTRLSPREMKTLKLGLHQIPVRLSSDERPWMIGYVCMTSNPFFAVTDSEGNFAITNAPPGNYVLEAYHVATHRDRPGETRIIPVHTGETTVADFVIQLPATLSSK